MLVKQNEKEQNSQANRKPVPKSINQIVKNLDNCTEEELEYLKNNFQYDHSAAYLESLQSDLLNKPNKPILFQKPVFVINPILLIKQFQTIEKNQRDFLLHDFQKDSAEYRKLFKWHGFETTRDLFTFVHLQLYVRKWKPSENLEEGEGLDLEEQAVMQKVLLHTGCHRSVPFKTKDIMSAMENLLDSNLTQIILHFSLAIFVFEHNGLEDGEFRILVAFQYSPNSPHLANFLKSRPGTKPILMHPDDLFDNFLGRDDPEEEIESDMMKLRRLLRDSELSYLYYGFSRK